MPSLFRWVISIVVAALSLAGASRALPGSAPAADDRLFAATDVTGVPWGRDFRMLGNDGERVQGVFITVDPRHDTPQVLAKYVTTFHSSFIGLYGDKQAVQHTAREFHVLASRAAHSTPVFLFDSAGRLRLIVRPEATPESIAHDMRLLLTRTPA